MTWIIIWSALALGALVAVLFALLRVNNSQKRISRSLDPIVQKSKGLKLEISAIKRSRLDRQRRLKSGK